MQTKIKESNTRTCVVIPKELKSRIEQRCEQVGVSFGAVTRMALNAWLEKQQKEAA